MKHLILVVLAAFVLMGCDQQKAAIENNKEATKNAIVFRGGVHGVLAIVDGVLGGFLIVLDGRLLLVAAHEDKGGEYYQD